MYRKIWRHFDFLLLGATLLLILYGIAMIHSAIAGSPGLVELPKRQAIYAAVGLVFMLALSLMDYHVLLEFRTLIYLLTVGLLVLVLVLGQATHGAQRWLDVKLFPVQPSELAKVLLTVTLAAHFATHQDEIKRFRVFVLSFLYVLPPIVLILLEPNLSASLSLAVLWLAIVFVAGVRWRYLIGVGAVGVLASPLAWLFMADYQRDRLLTFLNPSHNPDVRYNVEHALISIGSGGWFGKGFALGSQSQLRFLRVRWSDFIFAVIGEELGMVGILVLFALLLIVIFRIFRNAEVSRDLFGRLIAAGVGTLILFQAMTNIGANVGLLPVTGVPLPFVSSGGSSLITLLIAEGLVQSVSLRRQKIEFQLASRI